MLVWHRVMEIKMTIPLTRLKIAQHLHGSIIRVPTCKTKL